MPKREGETSVSILITMVAITRKIASDVRSECRKHSGNTQLDHHDGYIATENGPGQSALLVDQSTTTKVRLKLRRLQWSTKLNEYVMGLFYNIIKLET